MNLFKFRAPSRQSDKDIAQITALDSVSLKPNIPVPTSKNSMKCDFRKQGYGERHVVKNQGI